MTIIHIACAGVEHIGRVEGNSWKKALKRQMLILYDAVKVIYGQDQQGTLGRALLTLKKQGYGKGTIYIPLSHHYPSYIWIVEEGEELHRVYKNAFSELDLPPDKKIVTPSGVVPMCSQGMSPRRN